MSARSVWLQARIAAIDAQITAMEAANPALFRMSADNVSAEMIKYTELIALREKLWIQYERASGTVPMFVRGRVRGLHGE